MFLIIDFTAKTVHGIAENEEQVNNLIKNYPTRIGIDLNNLSKELIKKLTTLVNTDSLLEEQHRNTRHGAIEKMNEIRARWAERYDFKSSENMLNEITGAIMNLKINKPNI